MHRSNAVCLYLNSEHNLDSCNSRYVMHLKCSVLVLSMCGRNIAFNNLRHCREIGGRGEEIDMEQAC